MRILDLQAKKVSNALKHFKIAFNHFKIKLCFKILDFFGGGMSKTTVSDFYNVYELRTIKPIAGSKF